MKTLYPDFDPDSTIPADFNFTHPVISDRDLVGRGKYPGNVLCCPVANWGWEPCDVDPTRSGVAYLAGLKGGCNLAPYSCSRVSCGGGAGIWACNEVSAQTVIIWEEGNDVNDDRIHTGLRHRVGTSVHMPLI
jgi:hypothetical protein